MKILILILIFDFLLILINFPVATIIILSALALIYICYRIGRFLLK